MVSDFAKTMRDWKRLCDSQDIKHCEHCENCPLYELGCDGIFEMPESIDWRLLQEKVDEWAAENPEHQYLTWAEWRRRGG